MPRITLKNLMGIPFDIAALSGPTILPANGEITVDVTDYDAKVFRASPCVEVSDAEADKGDDIDALRAAYRDKTGAEPDGRWKADRLKTEIEKAS